MSEQSPAPWLSLVGIGEDGVEGLSPAACTLIRQAEVVVGGKRHLELAASVITGESLAWLTPIERTLPAILAKRGRAVCVLASGDPFFYGVGSLLTRHIPSVETRCLPQPSAFSLVAARLGWGLQDCECLSVHGRPLSRLVPHLQDRARLLVLSWDGTTPGEVAELLRRRKFGRSRLWVCERLGGPAERILQSAADTFDLEGIADLNTVAIEIAGDPDSRRIPAAPGLPEEWFEHDGQITKAPIRAVTLAALQPHPGETLWDVGAGSGSVGIEWLLACRTALAVAVENRSDRAARIRRNSDAMGVGERLTMVEGSAPEALSGLPAPDAIFVGGGLTASALFERCRDALKPRGRLVANAVTIESQAVLSRLFGTAGGELLTLAFAQAEPVGGFHGFRPAMPVMQWRWTKP